MIQQLPTLVVIFAILISVCRPPIALAQFYTNCDDSPCQHGTCEDLYKQTAYKCHCFQGFEGTNCDKPTNQLDFLNPDATLYTTTPSLDIQKCGAECFNGGTCNQVSLQCECRSGYHGLHCEHTLFHSKADLQKIYSTHDQCSYDCAKGSLNNGQVCHYKHLEATRACICHQTSEKICMSVLNDFNACKADCMGHYSIQTSLKNSTRFCNFFYSRPNVEPVARTCRCVHSPEESEWCVFHNDEPHGEVSLWSLVKSVVSFFSFVFVIYLVRLLVGWCFECLSIGVWFRFFFLKNFIKY